MGHHFWGPPQYKSHPLPQVALYLDKKLLKDNGFQVRLRVSGMWCGCCFANGYVATVQNQWDPILKLGDHPC